MRPFICRCQSASLKVASCIPNALRSRHTNVLSTAVRNKEANAKKCLFIILSVMVADNRKLIEVVSDSCTVHTDLSAFGESSDLETPRGQCFVLVGTSFWPYVRQPELSNDEMILVMRAALSACVIWKIFTIFTWHFHEKCDAIVKKLKKNKWEVARFIAVLESGRKAEQERIQEKKKEYGWKFRLCCVLRFRVY